LLTEGAARDLLEQQLIADADHVTRALSQLRLTSPLSCLALVYAADEELASVSLLYGWTQAARDAAFAADADAALWSLWGPADWEVEYDAVVEPPTPLDGTAALTRLLLQAGCDEPAGAVLMDLAYRLNRSPLPVELARDFACWASEHEMDDEPWRWMTAVARSDTVAQYDANGWLRLPDDR